MNRLFKTTSITIIPAVPAYPGIPASTYCPPCTVTPAGGGSGPPDTGGNGDPTNPGGGPKTTCILVPTGSTCVIVNGVPVGVNCQTVYTQICR